MKSFLHIVADDLKRRLGDELGQTVIVFPNKRASLFLNEHFTPKDERPVWMPRYMSVSELFLSLSHRSVADPIETICRLFNHYRRLTGSDETLDYFYGWGERLLADFDDIDKNMADPEKVFRDLRDYATTGAFDILTDEQVEQLHTFSKDFAKERLTQIRLNFLRLWDKMLPIYYALREELSNEGMAYEGQLFREVAEGLRDGTVVLPEEMRHVVFIGFNVIDRVEQTLFESLQTAGKALFYWDYDVSYARRQGDLHHEAGIFLQDNLQRFPGALDEEDGVFDNFLRDREGRTIEYVAAATNQGQAQSVREWLTNPAIFNPAEARETAIILCDEGLLQPVLHAIPETVGEANITKGFPLTHTPAFAGLVREIETIETELDKESSLAYAQGKGDYHLPEGKNCMPYVERLLKTVKEEAFTMTERVKDDIVLGNLYGEAYFRLTTTLQRFLNLLEGGLLTVSLPTLFRLIRQILRSLSIPFHGEPAEGLQIMGVLETRCLDFKRIVMLSVGDGILPERVSESSFIPALIRREYGLTTPERKVAVYAYYFYRLLERAEHVRLVYNDSAEGMTKGEMSRFMKTLLVEQGERLAIRHLRIESIPRLFHPSHEEAPKATGNEPLFKRLSPSALKTYLRCQKMFYYKYVLHLKTPQTQDAVINANDFGTVFHKAAQTILIDEFEATNHAVTPERIQRFFENGGRVKLESYVRRAFNETQITASEITVTAIVRYLRQLFEYEGGMTGKKAPALSFLVKGLEEKHAIDLTVPFGKEGRHATVRIEGDIDRLDEAVLEDGNRVLRVIDYKTGKKKQKNNTPINCTMDVLFTPAKDFPENELQVMLYSLMVGNTPRAVMPLLYHIPSMSAAEYTSTLLFEQEPLTDVRPELPEFRNRLVETLAELIDPTHPFPATEVDGPCKFCDFAGLCSDWRKVF